jgi:hypothetical protein
MAEVHPPIVAPVSPVETAQVAPAVQKKDDSSSRNAYLGILERIISRMGQTHFSTKAWSLSVLAAVFGFGSKVVEGWPAALLLVPVLLFWYLDATYYRREKLYRALFADAAEGKAQPFSTDTSKYAATCTLPRAFWSPTVFLVHSLLVAAVLVKLAWPWLRRQFGGP